DERLLRRLEPALEYDGEHADHQALATEESLVVVVTRRRIERVETMDAAGVQLHDRHAEPLGERAVLTLRIVDGDEALGAVDADLAVQERLDGRRLALARSAGDEDVGVGERAAVQLERVEEPSRAATGDVDAEVRTAPCRSGARLPRIERRQVGCRPAMARQG